MIASHQSVVHTETNSGQTNSIIQGSATQMPLVPFELDVIKGWTRVSCVAFIALVACDLDVTDSANVALLKPLEQILDKAWLVPMHVPWTLGLIFPNCLYEYHSI